jgi:hypothetical protein
MTRQCKFTYNSFFYNKGDVAQCCMQDAPLRKTKWSDIKNLDTFYMDNPEFTNIRQSLDSGIEHAACRSCWADERMYGDSMRTNNTYYSDKTPASFGIRHVDLRLSNKCNLQCKMCNPHDSSQLADIAINVDDDDIYHPLHNKIPKDESADNEILLTHILQLPNLETIRFAGGEPFIMPEVINFLVTLIHYGKTDISIEFITNCTSATPKLVSILEQFKKVTMICSIDGVNDTIEYQRYPAKWSIIENSFKRLYNSKIHSIGIAPCIGLLNYLTLDKLFIWASQFPNASISYNEIYEPTFLNFRYIPVYVRSQFYDTFGSIDLTHASPKWQQFRQSIMYETLEPTIEDCTMLYRYSTKVWDVNCKYKFLDVYPWAEYMIAKAVQQ